MFKPAFTPNSTFFSCANALVAKTITVMAKMVVFFIFILFINLMQKYSVEFLYNTPQMGVFYFYGKISYKWGIAGN
jgi:hypothetical protein